MRTYCLTGITLRLLKNIVILHIKTGEQYLPTVISVGYTDRCIKRSRQRGALTSMPEAFIVTSYEGFFYLTDTMKSFDREYAAS